MWIELYLKYTYLNCPILASLFCELFTCVDQYTIHLDLERKKERQTPFFHFFDLKNGKETCKVLRGTSQFSLSVLYIYEWDSEFVVGLNWQVDAFTESAFKGNPAAVCLLEEEDQRDEKWFQLVAAEFNISTTCYLTQLTHSDSPTPQFRIRWFSPVAEVCTLACNSMTK